MSCSCDAAAKYRLPAGTRIATPDGVEAVIGPDGMVMPSTVRKATPPLGQEVPSATWKPVQNTAGVEGNSPLPNSSANLPDGSRPFSQIIDAGPADADKPQFFKFPER